MPPKDVPMPFRTALPWAGFVALLFLLNYMSRSTLTPLLVSIEKDLGMRATRSGENLQVKFYITGL